MPVARERPLESAPKTLFVREGHTARVVRLIFTFPIAVNVLAHRPHHIIPRIPPTAAVTSTAGRSPALRQSLSHELLESFSPRAIPALWGVSPSSTDPARCLRRRSGPRPAAPGRWTSRSKKKNLKEQSLVRVPAPARSVDAKPRVPRR